MSGDVGETVTIPIEVGDVTGEDITSYQFTLPYDASILQVTGVNTEGTITPSDPVVNTQNEGEVRVSFAAAEPLEGEGTLLNLEAELVGAGTAALSFSEFSFFDSDANEVPSSLTSGSVTTQGINVSLPSIDGDAGDTLTIPVDISDITGKDVTSYEFTVSYDPSILSVTGVDTTGTLTPSQPTVNTGVSGEVRVSFAAAEPLEGSGTLLKLKATLTGAGTSSLTFDKFQLFDSNAAEVETVTSDGTVTSTGIEVRLPNLSSDAGASVTIPIEVEDLSDKDITSYQFTLPYDASVLEITGASIEGTITPSDPTVNTNTEGEIRVSFAAAEPLQGSGTLLKLEATLVGAGSSSLSFSDFQFFDSDANAVAATPIDGSITSSGIPVTIDNLSGRVGSSVTIPIQIGDLSGKNVTSYEFTLPYDASVLEITGASIEGTITPSDPTVNTNTEGEVRVAFAAAEPLEGSGTLLKLEANLIGSGTSALEFSRFQLFNNNSQEVATSLTAGSIEAVGIRVSLPDVGGDIGDTLAIPISVEDVTGEDITSYQFTLQYDASILTITGANIEGAITPSDPTINTNTPGQVSVSFAAAEPLEGEGVLLNLEAELIGEGTSTISFSEFRFFDSQANEVATTLSDGSVTVAGLRVRLPNLFATLDEGSIMIPIDVEDLSGSDVTSYQFTLTYNSSIIQITGANIEGTLTPSAPTVNASTPGEVRVSFAAAEPLEGSGTLLKLEADLLALGSTDLTFSAFQMFDSGANEVPTTPNTGSVTVTPGARAQFIHNAADPDLSTVDVYMNGTLTIDDFAFRSATPFMDVPADVELDIGIAPGNSSSVSDTLANFPVTFAADGAYTVVANGVVNPSDFASNPGGADTALDLFVADGAQETGSGSGSVDFRAVHGVTDAPAVDVIRVGGPTLLGGLSYGNVTGYQTTEANVSVITVAPASGGSPVAAFRIDLSNAGGAAATVVASGFLTPGSNQGGPGLALLGVLADGTVVEFPSLAFPQAVSVDISKTFADATQQSNYILAGLPGQVDLSVSSTLEGENPGDWRVFWDNGASSVDQGLVEFDGSGTFNFQPGKGFWMLSRNPWAVSQSFDPVSLNADGTASIPLHSGWNIISNPFGKDISWAAVQSVNSVSQDLWSWSGSFSTASSFSSAQNGQAFYFLNDQGLDALRIPFFTASGASSAAVAAKQAEASQMLTLTVYQDGERASAVQVGMAEKAEQGRDAFDQFAPPGYFESASLRLANKRIESTYTDLASDVRPVSAKGNRFNVTLRAEPGATLELKAEGLDQFGGQEVKLVSQSTASSYDLHADPTVQVSPAAKETKYVLLVGSKEFVANQQERVVPDQLKLMPNYPNPFRGRTTLQYALPEQADVRLVVYDVLGRKVRTLVNENQRAGLHTARWDGRNDAGQPVASGLYLTRLKVGDRTQVNKMLLVK